MNQAMHSNYHTHCCYCDGKGEPEAYVAEALRLGFTHLGFSSHAPVPFENKFALPAEKFRPYVDEIRRLQSVYAGQLHLSLGLEIDYIPGVMEDFSAFRKEGGLDYCIGSVHIINKDRGTDFWSIDGGRYERYDEGLQRVFGGDIRAGVKAFYRQNNEMIQNQRPDIVGHFNKIEMHNRNRYFLADEPWYVDLCCETLTLMHETGCICEINTRGIYKGRYPDFYPSKSIIRRMKELKIPVIVSTDAHLPEELSLEEGAYAFLQEIHYPEIVRIIP